jgi:hypothetical protein
MTKVEIQEAQKKLRDRLAEANAEVERVHLEMRLLKARCDHPDKFRTSHMGESCVDCPDCGACVS